ncbi:MAG: S8 family peptidase [Clostridiales bacterium]|jgi:subtilisin family serine protease|nr:S8 family peptidase [Clostridiales bacterium]
MIDEDRTRIIGDEYFDLIVKYRTNTQVLNLFEDATLHIMNDLYAVLHVPVEQFLEKLSSIRYAEIPLLFGLTDEVSLDATRVLDLRRTAAFNLKGEGVIIAIIDTGIDYTNPIFRRPDGTTKIISIWDQSIHTGPSPEEANFGTIYTAEQINQALISDDPFAIVPSVDENGHGTMLAGIAAGNDVEEEDFYGVAPDSDLVIVKLRNAKQSVRNFFLVPETSICFQENHIMWAMQYCVDVARQLNRPLVICLGFGSSQGGHTGRSPVSVIVNILADIPNTGIVISAGNEGNMARHYYGEIDPQIGSNTVELNVSEEDKGFTIELWGNPPGIYSVDILSPSGEYIPRIPPALMVSRVISFIFETTRIFVNYQLIESQTGDQLILFRFENASAGIWRFNVYGHGDMATGFHMWLPMGDFITRDTYFIQPNIYTTVLDPGTAIIPITVTTYNPINENLYVNSSRGFTRDNIIKPEIAAPGVNYLAPTLSHTFEPFTGTSVSTAHTAGVVALMLEWGTVRGNDPGMDSGELKNHLIRGARRRANIVYPNRDWGYGILDIINVFESMRVDSRF